MFRYVDALCLLPLYMYPKTHTHMKGKKHIYCSLIVKVVDCAIDDYDNDYDDYKIVWMIKMKLHQ